MEIYLFIGIIAFCAGFIQGLSGFGSVLLSLPLLALFLEVKTAIPLVALFGVALTAFLLLQLRRYWEWKKIYPLCLGALPGVPLGVWFLNRTEAQFIQWSVGAVLVVFALYSLLSKPSFRATETGWAYASGFIAGCLGGAISAAGPPVIIYTSLQSWSKDQIKVTLQGFFIISGIVVVIFQTIGGLVTERVLWYFFAALPMLLGGTWVGSLLYGRMREETYRKILLILMGLLGLFMILK